MPHGSRTRSRRSERKGHARAPWFALFDPAPVTAIVIQYHVQIKRRRGRIEEGGGRR